MKANSKFKRVSLWLAFFSLFLVPFSWLYQSIANSFMLKYILENDIEIIYARDLLIQLPLEIIASLGIGGVLGYIGKSALDNKVFNNSQKNESGEVLK